MISSKSIFSLIDLNEVYTRTKAFGYKGLGLVKNTSVLERLNKRTRRT